MFAAQVTKFGGPEVIEVNQIPIPEPKEDEVRINLFSFCSEGNPKPKRHGPYYWGKFAHDPIQILPT